MSLLALYGLRLDSEIDLPGVPEAPLGPPDAAIRLGPVLSRSTQPLAPGCFELRPGHVFLWTPGAGAVLVHAGREVVVEPADGHDAGLLRSVLLGQALAALLLQRGRPTLHGSAVDLGGEAGVAAFVGAKGAGKSTLAAALVQAGCPLVTDDLVVPTLPGSAAAVDVEPGYGYVKLWEASAAATGVDTAGLATVAAAVPKHLWTTPVGAARRPLRAVFELHIGPDLDVTPVSGIEALVTLARHTFAGGIAVGAGQGAAHLGAVGALARAVPVFRLSRPLDLAHLGETVRLIQRHMRDTSARQI